MPTTLPTTVPYLLVFRHSNPQGFADMGAEERARMWAQWTAWYQGLADAGKVRGANPLEQSGRVISGAGGKHVVDGPFAEAKEAIGGYFLLEVSGLEEATAIARRCPSLGGNVGLSVEIRPVAEACPFLRPDAVYTGKAFAAA